MRVKSVALLAVLALCALAPAMAARAEDWIVTPGVRFRIKPPYEGADNHVISVLPALTIRPAQRDYRFNPPDGGASLSLIDTTLLVAGPVVRFRGSRGDDGKLTGLTRIPVATEPGAFIALWPTPWLRARVEARRGISGHHGWVEDVGLDLIHTAEPRLGQRWDASIGPRAGFGDANYMDTYFGLTPEESALHTPHLPAYAPGAGMRYTGAAAAAAYHLTQRWRMNFDLTFNHLSAKALASPVVRTVGDGNQLLAGVGFSYSFGLHL